MNLNERISKIIEYSGFTSSEFADEVEVQRSSISHITSGRNKPSLDFLVKVKDRFPEFQWDWLIKGDGEMLETKEIEPEIVKTEEKPKTTSLPDLFSLIDDENFGITESEDKVQKKVLRESHKSASKLNSEILSDSQQLETQEAKARSENTEYQKDKIKRVVLFFESGKFESYEL